MSFLQLGSLLDKTEEGNNSILLKVSYRNITNVIFLVSWVLGEHQNLFAGFSGDNNRGYCSCTGPR